MNQRQNELLKEIVENYIKYAKPIGSKFLCNKFKCSSATIRNEMAELENLGYIEKTHISSGRVPSEKGYKYYAKYLMKPKEITGDDVLKLQTILNNKELVISDTIQACMEIISEMTNYTSIVLGKSSKECTLKQINIVPLNSSKIVAVLVTDKGSVHNKQMNIPSNIDYEELVKTSEIINKLLIGTPLNEINSRLEFEIKPEIAKIVDKYNEITEFFHQTFDKFANSESEENVFFSGKANILNQPEYDSPEKIKEIIAKFEDKDLISKIESNNSGINIYIGEESEFDPDVTIIKTSYNADGEEGTIAIVGPKRMEYDKVVTLLNYIKSQIENKN